MANESYDEARWQDRDYDRDYDYDYEYDYEYDYDYDLTITTPKTPSLPCHTPVANRSA